MDASLLRAALVALSAFALPACSEDAGEPSPEPEARPAALTCADDDLQSARPFGGAGYDASQGGLLQPAQDSYLASTTLLALKPDEAAQQRFTELMGPIFQALATQDGLIGFELATSQKCGYGRTITVWRDEEALMGFVMSDPHVAAMSEATSISFSAAVASWEITAPEIPISWEVARAKADAAKPSY
jgi:heme-degrading monooxygenase HmoA